LGNNQGNFKLHRLTRTEKNPQKVLGGYFFDSHCRKHPNRSKLC